MTRPEICYLLTRPGRPEICYLLTRPGRPEIWYLLAENFVDASAENFGDHLMSTEVPTTGMTNQLVSVKRHAKTLLPFDVPGTS